MQQATFTKVVLILFIIYSPFNLLRISAKESREKLHTFPDAENGRVAARN
jgi:hypothetical protein